VKTVKRNGLSFYQGLIARPESEVIENPVFANALEEIRAGILTPKQAGEKYGIRESALVAAVVWLDDDNDETIAVKASLNDGSLSSVSTTESSSCNSDLLAKRHILKDRKPGNTSDYPANDG
jgi:hypothetical protein